jgi:hypothetical protein
MELFKVSEAHFGWIFAFIAAGLISASQVNNIALKHFSSQQIIKVAASCQSIIGVLFVCFTLLLAQFVHRNFLCYFFSLRVRVSSFPMQQHLP